MATIGRHVIQEPVPPLAEYGGISIAFTVSEVFDVVAEADGGTRLEARPLPLPYVKDYDVVGDHPLRELFHRAALRLAAGELTEFHFGHTAHGGFCHERAIGEGIL